MVALRVASYTTCTNATHPDPQSIGQSHLQPPLVHSTDSASYQANKHMVEQTHSMLYDLNLLINTFQHPY